MRLLLALRALFFVLLLPGTVAGYIPLSILRAGNLLGVPDLGLASVCAAVIAITGALVLFRCVWDFFAAGKGTLAPIDPPRVLVIRGLYRFTRTPCTTASSPSSSRRRGSSGASIWLSKHLQSSSSSIHSWSCTRNLPSSHCSGSRIGPTGVPFPVGASRLGRFKRAPGAPPDMPLQLTVTRPACVGTRSGARANG
jgi:hypothetical protein